MSRVHSSVVIVVKDSTVEVIGQTKDTGAARLVVPVHPFLKVEVNGERVTGNIQVGMQDLVQVQVLNTPPTRHISLTISNDSMKAQLLVRYVQGVERWLQSIAPTEYAVLRVEERLHAPEKFTLQDVEEELSTQHIAGSIDWDTIEHVINHDEGGQCICAEGVEPTAGEPERYDLISFAETAKVGITPILPILTVSAGTIVAERRPAVEGTAGSTVNGQAVPPRQSKQGIQKLGNGVEDTNGLIISRRSGRVVFTSRLLDVVETLVIDEPHRLVDGHVLFDGDVVFQKDIGEGVEVIAGGKVYVNGSVSHANISADDGVIVSNGVVASTLRAGLKTRALKSLHPLFFGLIEELQSLRMAVSQLEQINTERNLVIPTGRILAKLLQEKFLEVQNWHGRFEEWQNAHSASIGPAWTSFISGLIDQLQPRRLTAMRTIRGLELLISLVEARIALLPSDEDAKEAWIQVRNAERSDLLATGDIVATGQGFYQCKVESQSAIKAMGHPGVLLGCEVVAGQSVLAREVGSRAEVPTTVEIQTPDGSITVGHAFPGTTLRYGEFQNRIRESQSNLVWP